MRLQFLWGILLLLLSFVSAGQVFASSLEIGRMRVAIWPEYDDPGVLVIYDGRFVDEGTFPTETTFLLPKGAVISDACSLSPRGQHFCQLFTQENAGDVDEVRLKLPYPNFYLSFHVKPFEDGNPLRKLNYNIRINHPVRKLEVDIQEPLRAEEFSVNPRPHKTEEIKGFRHYRHYLNNQDKGKSLFFEISYKKADDRPSVNIKYSPMAGGMTGQMTMGSPHEERGMFVKLLYALVVSGFVLLAGLLWLVFRRKKA